MDDNRLYSELKKEKDYCVGVMALLTAIVILLVMTTVIAMTGNHILTLAGGAITFCVILIVQTALKVQRNSILMQLVRVRADDPAPEKQTYDASGKLPIVPEKGQHTDLQS